MWFLFPGNSAVDLAAALGVALAVAILLGAVRQYLITRLERNAALTPTAAEDWLLLMLRATYKLFILIAALYAGSMVLELSARQDLIIRRVVVSAFLLQAAMWGDTGVRAWRVRYRRRAGAPDSAVSVLSTAILDFLLRLAVWLVALLMVLDNLGFNITTLVASLGIGGIAVALAVQNILGDLFASLSIVLDKPFVLGDFIIVDDILGTVEYIGLKTTRLRSLGGEQVVFSNGDLLKARIRNHQRMQTRRAAFIIRVTYDTTEAQLRAIPDLVRTIVSAQPDVNFERAHLFALAESSLDFEVVYWILSPDYLLFMNAQQAIYLSLVRQFREHGIRFAHPIRKVRLSGAVALQGGETAEPSRPPLPCRLQAFYFDLRGRAFAAPPDLGRERRSGHGAADQPCQVGCAVDRAPVDRHNNIERPDAGPESRAAALHARHQRALGFLQAEPGSQVVGQLLELYADMAARHLAMLAQLLRDLHGDIDRNGKGDTHVAPGLAVDLRVDADDIATQVEQRPARIAGIEGDVGLDEGNVAAVRQQASLGADDADRHAVLEAERRADRGHPIARFHGVGIAGPHSLQPAGGDLEQGHVGIWIGANEPGRIFALVGQLDPDRVGAGNHMRIGQDIAIGADDETRPHAAVRHLAGIGNAAEAAEKFIQRMAGRHRRLIRRTRDGADVDDRAALLLDQIDEPGQLHCRARRAR